MVLTLSRRWQIDPGGWPSRPQQLAVAFVDRTLSAAFPSLREENDLALEAVAAIRAQVLARGPRRTEEEEVQPGACLERQVLRQESPGLDPFVLAGAVGWIDLRAASSPGERVRWVLLLREVLDVWLRTFPKIEATQRQEIDGLPGSFDEWVLSLLARSLLNLDGEDEPSSFWKPILDLGAPAHHWVERFFWEWFTSAFEQPHNHEDFTRTWGDMIEYATGHALWSRADFPDRDVAEMVVELLGCNFGLRTVARDNGHTSGMSQLAGHFKVAARRWLSLPEVAHGLAHLLILPAAAGLLVRGVRWLHEAATSFDEHEWGHWGLQDSFVQVLRACWERHRGEVAGNQAIREPFLGLLTHLVAQGSHAATVLSEQVAAAIRNG